MSPKLLRGQPPRGQLLFSGALSGAVCPRSLFEASLLEANFFSPGLCRGLRVPEEELRLLAQWVKEGKQATEMAELLDRD